MKGEILKLLYIYSLNKRIFDKTAIEILYNIFINNNYDIEKYFKKIIITNEDDIVALYSQEKNSIIININKIIKEFTEGIKVFKLDEIQGYFFLNTQLLVCLFHELEHIKQRNIAQENTIFGKFIYYGITLNKKNSSDEHDLKERIKIYNATYYYNPCERDAYITSPKVVKSIIDGDRLIHENILANLNWLILKSEISGYTKKRVIIPPSEMFFKYINKEEVLKEYCFSSDSRLIEYIKTKRIFTLDERLRYGLMISNSEYNGIIKARDEIKRRVLKK
ncbi:MAG TPA: hypothetical protein DHV54_01965 [Firmicutes bacterium]|nr:hypothetical protein [Bacillota bacterium]